LVWTDAERLGKSSHRALLGPGAPYEFVVDPTGAASALFAQRPRCLGAVLDAAAERFGDRICHVFPTDEFSFSSLRNRSVALAAALAHEYGIGKGDRVAIAAANSPEYLLTLCACAWLGAISVGLNGWWTGPEMQHGIALTEPRLIVGDAPRLERLTNATTPVVSFDIDFAALATDTTPRLPEVHIDENDPYAIVFTSGTTGRAKGATLSHRSQIHLGLASLLGASANAAIHPPPATGDSAVPCSIMVGPLFHVSGLNPFWLTAMTGAKVVHPPPGRWSEDVYLELTERHRVTSWSPLVPTQLWRLLRWPELDRYDLRSVRGVAGGGTIWPPELLRALEARLPWIRPGIALGYGSTETNGLGTILRQPDSFEHPESVGRASPGVEVEVRDPITGEVRGENEVGEIHLRTGSLFLGYWNDVDATRGAVDAERWYATGDLGRVTAGFLHLAGRCRELIIRAGENIYPIEIENRLLEHPSVAEVAVVGVEHPTLAKKSKHSS
jgi:acyl-CoA synthetase (AMP-forming)/AMP-acid ligase II